MTIIDRRPYGEVNPTNNLLVDIRPEYKIADSSPAYSNVGFDVTFLGWSWPTYLFPEPEGIKEISVTFDQLGRPLVFYRINEDDLYIYRFNFLTQVMERSFLTNGVNPIASFDYVYDTTNPDSDALLFFRRGTQVIMLMQRDLFAIEYLVPIQLAPDVEFTIEDIKLYDAGYRIDNRFQLRYLEPSKAPPAPIPPPLPLPLGIYDYRGRYSVLVMDDKVANAGEANNLNFGFVVRGTQKLRDGNNKLDTVFGYISRDVNTDSGKAKVKYTTGLRGYLEFDKVTGEPSRWVLDVWGIYFECPYDVIDKEVEVSIWYEGDYLRASVRLDTVELVPIREKQRALIGGKRYKKPLKSVNPDSYIIACGEIALKYQTPLYEPIKQRTHKITSSNWVISNLWYKKGSDSRIDVPFNLMYNFFHNTSDPAITGTVLGHIIHKWVRQITEKQI